MFLNPNFFSNSNLNFSNLLDIRNLQEHVKKAFCYQKLFWPFNVWINCSSDLKIFANSQLSASNFKNFYRSLEHFFLTVGQNNFGNKIQFLIFFFHYRESKYIGILMAVTIPAWLAWMLSAFVLNESYGPPCFGFGLIGVCMITFVVMFVPKSRQLSAIGELI